MTNTANTLNDLPDIDAHPEFQDIPCLPGHHIAERAIDAVRHVIHNPDSPRGTFVGDRDYLFDAHEDKLQLPLLRAGYEFLGDYRDDHVGKHHLLGQDDGGRTLALPDNAEKPHGRNGRLPKG